jgi:hypothetical protein
MNEQKSFVYHLAEAVERYRAERCTTAPTQDVQSQRKDFWPIRRFADSLTRRLADSLIRRFADSPTRQTSIDRDPAALYNIDQNKGSSLKAETETRGGPLTSRRTTRTKGPRQKKSKKQLPEPGPQHHFRALRPLSPFRASRGPGKLYLPFRQLTSPIPLQCPRVLLITL